MSEKHKCCARVSFGGGWYFREHGITAKYEYNGKWYCKRHCPPNVESKSAEREAKWKRKREEEAAASKANAPAASPWRPISELPDGLPEILLIEKRTLFAKLATWEDVAYVTAVFRSGGVEWEEIFCDEYTDFAEIRRLER